MDKILKSESKNLNIKFLQFIYKNTKTLSKPKSKFLKDFLLGMFRAKHVFLNAISRSLQEDISPKQTAERLNYHLSNANSGQSVPPIPVKSVPLFRSLYFPTFSHF